VSIEAGKPSTHTLKPLKSALNFRQSRFKGFSTIRMQMATKQSWLSSMLTGVILNPHQLQKKNLIKQSPYLTTTAFYQKRDGKQFFA